MISEPRPDHAVWLDGEFVPFSAATMQISDHHYGVGVFEGVRAYANAEGAVVFRLREHTERLLRSAHILRMGLPQRFDRDHLERVQLELLRRNRLRDAYLRPFVFYSGIAGLAPGTRDLRVRVAVLALEWTAERAGDAEGIAPPMTLRTSSFVRQHPNSVLAKAKANGNYMNGILAREEARECGADDALLLDQDGYVTETSGANVFVVANGALYTPPLTSALAGITRDSVIVLAASFGMSVSERRMTRDELYIADEVFITGTAVEIRPVRSLDGRAIGSAARGPVTERLQRAYADHVRGREVCRHGWLTSV